MSAPICRSDTAQPPALQRAKGAVRGEFVNIGGRTRQARVFETGGLRLRFPNVARGCEGVIINTAGGIVGGDLADYTFDAGPLADATITTQSAEKVYRARSGAAADSARIAVSLNAAAGARLEWLPQESILFDGARVSRKLEVEIAADAQLLMLECVVFGRAAMDETQVSGAFHDRWRVRRAGILAFADDLRLDGSLTGVLDRPACGAGVRSVATILLVAPEAEARLDAVREQLEAARCEWGASAWNGLMSGAPETVRGAISSLLLHLRERDAPRVWT